MGCDGEISYNLKLVKCYSSDSGRYGTVDVYVCVCVCVCAGGRAQIKSASSNAETMICEFKLCLFNYVL